MKYCTSRRLFSSLSFKVNTSRFKIWKIVMKFFLTIFEKYFLPITTDLHAWLNQLLINWLAGLANAGEDYELFALVNQIVKYYLLLIKYISLKSDLNLLKTFLIQTYILSVFNGETLKVILFSKINRFFTFDDTGLDTHRFYQKIK